MAWKRKTFADLSKDFDKFWFDTDPPDKPVITVNSKKEIKSNNVTSITTAAGTKKIAASSGKRLKYPFSSDVSDLFQRFNSVPPKLYHHSPRASYTRLMRGSPKAEMLRANLILEGIGLKGTRSMASLADEPEFIPSTLINQIENSSESGSGTTEFDRRDLQSVPGIMNLNELSGQNNSAPTSNPHPYSGYREDSIFFKTYNAVAAKAKAKSVPKIPSAADKAFDLFSIHNDSKPKPGQFRKVEPKKYFRKTREELDALYAASSYGSLSASTVSVKSDPKEEKAGDGIGNSLPADPQRDLEKSRESKGAAKEKTKAVASKKLTIAPKPFSRGRSRGRAPDSSSSSQDTIGKNIFGDLIRKKSPQPPQRLQRSRSPRNYIHRPLFWNQDNSFPHLELVETPRPSRRPRKIKRRKPTRKEREEERFEIFAAGQRSPDRVLFKLDQIVSRAAIRGAKERKRNRKAETIQASHNLESKGSQELELLKKRSSQRDEAVKNSVSLEPRIAQSESATKKLSPKPSAGLRMLSGKDTITKTTAMAKFRFAAHKKNLEMLREQQINMIRRVSSYNRYRNDPAEREMEMMRYITRNRPRGPHVRKQAQPVKRAEPTTPRTKMDSERSERIKENLEELKNFAKMSVQLSAKKKVEQWLKPLNTGTYASSRLTADDDFVYLAKNRQQSSGVIRKGMITTIAAPSNRGSLGTRQDPPSTAMPPGRKLPSRMPLWSNA